MHSLEKIKNEFDIRISDIDEMTNVGDQVAEFASGLLIGLKSEADALPANIPLKQKLQRAVEQFQKFRTYGAFPRKYKLIYAQALVLLVSAFEVFLTEVAKAVINDTPALVRWPEKKIGFNLSILEDASHISLGEVILRSWGEVNFQDLQSTVRFFCDYIGLDKEVLLDKELQSQIILTQAKRHVILHNNAIVDSSFIEQIRDTDFVDNYRKSERLEIAEEDFQAAKSSLALFSERLLIGLKARIGEDAHE